MTHYILVFVWMQAMSYWGGPVFRPRRQTIQHRLWHQASEAGQTLSWRYRHQADGTKHERPYFTDTTSAFGLSSDVWFFACFFVPECSRTNEHEGISVNSFLSFTSFSEFKTAQTWRREPKGFLSGQSDKVPASPRYRSVCRDQIYDESAETSLSVWVRPHERCRTPFTAASSLKKLLDCLNTADV